MSVQPTPKPRERIVSAAAKLFYDHGINAVGIAQICQAANVSKRTLYQHFDTKDALVVASMSALGAAWFEACTQATATNPKERIRHVFAMVEPMAEKEDFFGCILAVRLLSAAGGTVGRQGARRFSRAANSALRRMQCVDCYAPQVPHLGPKNPGLTARQVKMTHTQGIRHFFGWG